MSAGIHALQQSRGLQRLSPVNPNPLLAHRVISRQRTILVALGGEADIEQDL
jgi:hypothetical protein